MPIKTVTQNFCDVCYKEYPNQLVDATSKLRFTWQSKSYVILTCDQHTIEMVEQFNKLLAFASPEGKAQPSPKTQGQSQHVIKNKSAFSSLSASEKDRFRSWVHMPNARHISDARVYEWIALGKP
ncbi:MAG: hypothetical protein M1374_04970 [Firmicutes bacterium]|nr:hypothetical protein [Bacillota bacterium]